jgi:hypothetical protein
MGSTTLEGDVVAAHRTNVRHQLERLPSWLATYVKNTVAIDDGRVFANVWVSDGIMGGNEGLVLSCLVDRTHPDDPYAYMAIDTIDDGVENDVGERNDIAALETFSGFVDRYLAMVEERQEDRAREFLDWLMAKPDDTDLEVFADYEKLIPGWALGNHYVVGPDFAGRCWTLNLSDLSRDL